MTCIVSTSGIGLEFANEDINVIIRGGDVSQGDLVALCIGNGDDEITGDSLTPSIDPGGKGSIFASATKVYDNETAQYGFFGVAMENIKDQRYGTIRVRGIVPFAFCKRLQGGTLSIGTAGIAGTTSTLGPTSSNGSQVPNAVASSVGVIDFALTGGTACITSTFSPKFIAIALAVRASGVSSTAAQLKVLFDGINGFGSANTL